MKDTGQVVTEAKSYSEKATHYVIGLVLLVILVLVGNVVAWSSNRKAGNSLANAKAQFEEEEMEKQNKALENKKEEAERKAEAERLKEEEEAEKQAAAPPPADATGVRFGFSLDQRKQIFYETCQLQKAIPDDAADYAAQYAQTFVTVGNKYGLTPENVRYIWFEGVSDNSWPVP